MNQNHHRQQKAKINIDKALLLFKALREVLGIGYRSKSVLLERNENYLR